MGDLLLEASGITKSYGAVAALLDASLAVRPGEIHALMGANGAGKSTLVKVLIGAVRPDAGTVLLRGRARQVHSPGEARRRGMVSVFQEPAIIPDLTVREIFRGVTPYWFMILFLAWLVYAWPPLATWLPSHL